VVPTVRDGMVECFPVTMDGGAEERDPTVPDPKTHIVENPPDLTLWNFFTEGWGYEFTRRPLNDRAPDLALLRVQTNFMEREVRLNYSYQANTNSTRFENLTNFDYFIAYAFNRRFMLEVLGNYQWEDGRGNKNPDLSGQAGQLVGRLQLISLADSSYTFNWRVISPNVPFGNHQTTFSYGCAGFEDLTRFGLYRVGLYGSFLFDSLAGPGAVGAQHNDVQYDISIAKTVTDSRTPVFGTFTFFLENFAQTSIDGANRGHTVFSMTPAVRFNLTPMPPGARLGIDNWILVGTDFPLSGPRPWDCIFRLSYIKNF
jgi:hypothetical protein